MTALWSHITKWTLFPGHDENTMLGMSISFFPTLKEDRCTQVVSTVPTTFPSCPLALQDRQCYRVDLESEMPTQPNWGVAGTLFCLRDAWTHLSWGFLFNNIQPATCWTMRLRWEHNTCSWKDSGFNESSVTCPWCSNLKNSDGTDTSKVADPWTRGNKEGLNDSSQPHTLGTIICLFCTRETLERRKSYEGIRWHGDGWEEEQTLSFSGPPKPMRMVL